MKKNSTNFGLSLLVIFIVLLVIILLKNLFGGIAEHSYQTHKSTLAERIKPIGSVYQEGDIDVTKIAKAKPKATKARSGKAIYSSVCKNCHSIGVAGAPKFGNKSDWAPRIKRGIKALLTTAINGKGAMPPRGTCGDCSDAELELAVKYMTSNSK